MCVIDHDVLPGRGLGFISDAGTVGVQPYEAGAKILPTMVKVNRILDLVSWESGMLIVLKNE
jgi:hypothetical protein